MKRCPTCERTFDDSMKFCQMDGMLLVGAPETAPQDSSVPISASRNETSAPLADSFETGFGSSIPVAKGENLSGDADSAKTRLMFGQETEEQSGGSASENETAKDALPSSPLGNQLGSPMPLPFDESKSSDYRSPASPFAEPETMFDKPFDSFNQSPFDNQAESYNPPMQPSEWMPPPAPVSEWQNQNIGQNTPFQPPMAGGQNQTLAIVSLVLGVIGIVLCQFTAPVALVTGFMARKKAEENPNEYGGSGLALAGIITGAIGSLLLVLVVIYIMVILGWLFTR